MLSFKPGVGPTILILMLLKILYMVRPTSSYDNVNDFFQFGENGTFKCQYFCDTSNNNDQSYFPPNFSDKCPPSEVLSAYISAEGESGVKVFWAEPVAVDKNGDIPRIEQVAADKNGSYFNGSAEGTIYNIVYLATNEDGLRNSCHFQFKVYDEVNCNTPVVVENGYYNCENDTTPNSVCTYKCNEGYNVTGKTDTTCQYGNHTFPVWTAAPTCEVIHCIAPSVPNNATITCNDSTYSYNSICSVTCDKGFTAEGPLYMICQEDGQWSRQTSCTYPDLLAVHCISPQIFYPDSKQTSMSVNWLPPSSAAIDKNMIAVNQIIGPTQGDKLEAGLFTVVYQMTSMNSNESSECRVDLHVKVVSCEHPTKKFNDSFMEFNCSLPAFILGVTCEISCKDNMEIAGYSSITCLVNNQQEGVWDLGPGHKTFCKDTLSVCPKIFNEPSNGKLIYKESDTLTEVRLVCKNEFDLQYKFPGYVSCVDGEWTSHQIPECNVKMKAEYLLYAELNFYGQGCAENATENVLDYKETFQNEFDEYIITKCPQNETCRVFNLSVECIPTTVERVRKEIRGVRSNFLDNKKAALHDVVKRSDTHKFVTSFNIEIETNNSHESLDYHEDMLKQIWKNSRNWVVAHTLQIFQETDNFTLYYFEIINHTVPICDDDHTNEGSLCRTCSIGYFYNSTSDRCQTCPVGTFKDFSGLATCLFCPDRTSTKGKGSVSMNDCKEFCRPGSVSPDGLVTCAVCQKGFYQDELRQTECKKCPDETTTVLANSTSIRECIAITSKGSCMTSSCNGHRCLSKNGSISCVCSYGWSGKNCKQSPDTCTDNICMNKAKCIERNNSYDCECQANYSGLLCEISPVNGGWAEWSGWSECSVTCKQGIQQRTRQCNNPSPSKYGDYCYDQTSQNKVCVRSECQACQQLKETNSSYYQCTIDHETGLETCSVRCKDGYIMGRWADRFRNLSCGMQTGFYWLPANITLHCSEPIIPKRLLLDATIEYKELIPSEYHGIAELNVRSKLLKTDCFKSKICNLNIYLSEVNKLNGTDDTYNRSKLYLEFQTNLQRNEINNTSEEVPVLENSPSLHEWKDAIEDMESTANYLNEFTHEVFDFDIDSRFKRSIKQTFTAVNDSLSIQGNAICDNGQVSTDGMCTKCSPGRYEYEGTCHLCIKGTYQPNKGQTACIFCPPGLTTDTIGAADVSQCIQCQQGKYKYEGTCYFCIKGTYQPDSGQTACSICPPGLTTDTIGAIHLSQCKYEEAFNPNDKDSDLTVVYKFAGIIVALIAFAALVVSVLKRCQRKGNPQPPPDLPAQSPNGLVKYIKWKEQISSSQI